MQESRCVGFRNALTLKTKSKTGSVIANYRYWSVSRRSFFVVFGNSPLTRSRCFADLIQCSNSKVTSLITYFQETFCENCVLQLP